MPTFCRHNRFIERCPICSKTLPGNEPASGAGPRRARGGEGTGTKAAAGTARRPHGGGLRVRREGGREADDGYRSELVPGLRASADAERLAVEIAFASARLAGLATDPPGAYAQAFEAAAGGDLERASWLCFLLAYLTPAEDSEPFAAVEAALAAVPAPGADAGALEGLLEDAPLGPRSSYRRGEAERTLGAYAQWVARSGGEGGQQAAFTGDEGWDAQRRFGRIFERLTLHGMTRAGRYELLLTLGRLGLYELAADGLHLASPRTAGGEDETTLAAKRVFGIGDPLLLDRRAATLAAEASAPIEALDLALFNWGAQERATMGFRPDAEPDAAPVAVVLGL